MRLIYKKNIAQSLRLIIYAVCIFFQNIFSFNLYLKIYSWNVHVSSVLLWSIFILIKNSSKVHQIK